MSTRTRRIAREVALTVGAALGVLCVATALAAPLLGMRLLVFESGSMSPTIDTGGAAITRTVDADRLAVGDIVSVTDADGVRITHRIKAIRPDGDQVLLELKGDANQRPDTETYPVTEADRVVAHVNGVGYVVDALASPYAVFLAGAGAAGLLVLTFRHRAGDTGPRHVRRRRRGRIVVPVGLAIAALAAGVAWVGGGSVTPTLAAFSDTAAVTAEASALTVPAPASLTCTNGGWFSGVVHLEWPAVADAPSGYQYLLEVYADDPAQPVVSRVVASPEAGTVTTELGRGELPSAGDYRIVIRGALDTTGWRSVDGVDHTVGAGLLDHEIGC